jgi:hypothetical protein
MLPALTVTLAKSAQYRDSRALTPGGIRWDHHFRRPLPLGL